MWRADDECIEYYGIALEALKDTVDRLTVKIPKHKARSCSAGKPRPPSLPQRLENILYKSRCVS